MKHSKLRVFATLFAVAIIPLSAAKLTAVGAAKLRSPVYVPGEIRSHHRMTSGGYQEKFDYYKRHRYRLVYVDGYSYGNAVRFAAIWRRQGGPSMKARHNMTSAEYQVAFDSNKRRGYCLAHVDGYSVAGKPRFAAIWELRRCMPTKAKHNMTSAQYQEAFDANKKLGYRLTHVSGYDSAGSARFAAIWRKFSGLPMRARHNMSPEQYQEAFDDYSAQGYKLMHVSAYNVNARPRFAAIWERRAGRFPARHNLNHVNYQNTFDSFKYQGYYLRRIAGYEKHRGLRYAAVWEYVGDDITRNDAIDAIVREVIESAENEINPAPSISLAIAKNERLVYAGGYGYSKGDKEILASPHTLYRIASISKPITSATIMKLLEDGMLATYQKASGAADDLDSYALGPGAVLAWANVSGASHLRDITVRQLLEHSAGGWGRSEGFSMSQEPDKGHKKFIKYILSITGNAGSGKVWELNVPGTKYDYSNFGYCILGRIIEEVTGETYEQYVRDEILSEMEIQNMQIGATAKGELQDGEAHYLSVSPNAPYEWDLQRMDSHGGWIASAIDLVRFAVRVDGKNVKQDLINAATWTTMTTPETQGSTTYAKGWRIMPACMRHGGMMTGSSSELRIYNDGVIIAVLANWSGVAEELHSIAEAIHDSISSWPTYDLF